MHAMKALLSRRALLVLVVTAFGALASAGVASATTFTVNDAVDAPLANPAGTACTSTHGGTCTLRAAVQAADNTGGANAINIPAGHYQLAIASTTTDDPSTGDLDVDKLNGASAAVALSITGAGTGSTVIDANHLDRAFAVHLGQSLAITGVTVENGSQNDENPSDHSSVSCYGGAFYNDGSLTIDKSALTDDSSYCGGGAVYSDSGATSTQITNTTATQDNTLGDDGSSGYGGGAVWVDGGSLAAANDNFSFDTSYGYEGGAIFASTSGSVSVTNSILNWDTAYEYGGAMALTSSGPTTVAGDQMANDDAGYSDGGAIYASSSGQLTVTATSFVNDTGADDGTGGAIYMSGTDLSATGSKFVGDSAGEGGAVEIDGSSGTARQTLAQDVFRNNNASDGDAGAVYHDSTGDLAITQSTFSGNNSNAYGGAIYYDSGTGMELTNDTLDSNQASYSGGAIYFEIRPRRRERSRC